MAVFRSPMPTEERIKLKESSHRHRTLSPPISNVVACIITDVRQQG